MKYFLFACSNHLGGNERRNKMLIIVRDSSFSPFEVNSDRPKIAKHHPIYTFHSSLICNASASTNKFPNFYRQNMPQIHLIRLFSHFFFFWRINNNNNWRMNEILSKANNHTRKWTISAMYFDARDEGGGRQTQIFAKRTSKLHVVMSACRCFVSFSFSFHFH